MAHSSTLSHVAGTAGSWLFAVACVGGSLYYFDEMRAVGRKVFGVPVVEQSVENAASLVGDETLKPASVRDGRVELTSDRRGHFVVEAQINGRSIEVMVDTGATTVAMSFEDAERAGIYVGPADFTQAASTANGMSRIAPVKIDSISIGGITVHDVRGAVVERGKLSGTLLGMTFLSRLSRAELSRGKLVLEE